MRRSGIVAAGAVLGAGVMLAATGLGHTAFGVLLVLAYGFGMVATLTAAGLVLIRLRARFGLGVATRAAITLA